MDSSDDLDASASQRKKRFHRHTPRQIQALEAMFKECPHPDEKQRMHLSRELGLEPRQIKFWFQNRRTQMKAQNERADNSSLRAENDRIRCENIAMKEALRRVVCPTCSGPPDAEDSFFDEEKLRLENARLKDELYRISSIASKNLGSPIPHLPRAHRIPISSLSLSVGGHGVSPVHAPSLDIDLLSGSSPSAPPRSFPSAGISEEERSLMEDAASSAMAELIRLVQAEEPLWTKSENGDREILDSESYNRIFTGARNQPRDPDLRQEASRASCVAMTTASKWMELFPTIVSKSRTIEVLSSGIGGRSGSLLLMYGELQVLSPVVSPRDFFFLRYCRQIDQSTWAIADVSEQTHLQRLLAITWVEHVEVEERFPIHQLYRGLVMTGVAFGAQRWAATLRRSCERWSACSVTHGGDSGALSGDGKRSMMKLSQRMVSNFCASMSAGDGHRWTTTLSGPDDVGVRVAVHRSVDPGQPNGVVLSATTSVWLPIPPEIVFGFLSNEQTRPQWDVLSNGNSVQEVAHISSGQDPRNCISLLRGLNASESTMLILQESCTNPSGSLVVYAPIDIPAINVVMSGEDPSRLPLLPSGFAIVSDEGEFSGGNGSLVTVAFQILVSSLPSAKLNMESVGTVNNLISTTVQQIKAALNCPVV
ncbi:unnamed protein product [Spirodela intermedia]|uniref:Uncharacterized protein n=1 Tax=Spirodela intermedia TaxID=51605 RepID=A0A7I8IMX6_SPIIN|nr:unnamed protein product [Spirodela intermedia]CAA6658497.1 unnamed protein product [Spirodela intermedia]